MRCGRCRYASGRSGWGRSGCGRSCARSSASSPRAERRKRVNQGSRSLFVDGCPANLPTMKPIAALKAALDSWLDTERERLAVWLPVFMGAGVLGYYALRFEPSPWIGAAIATPVFVLAVWLPGVRWLFG